MIKVLLIDKPTQKAVELLNEIPEFEIVTRTEMPPDRLKQEIKNYEAVVVSSTTALNKDILESARNLRIIVRAGIGLETVDVEFARSKNIEVKDTPFAASITVAEYTLAKMLGICRFIGPAYRSMKARKWEKKLFSQGMEMYGKTAGIIGMGRIGREVARRELAMGMNVLYYDIAKIETGMDVRQVSLDELLLQSDFISVHIPLTELTANLISTDAFGKMKNGVIFVNVSSGGVVDMPALSEALASDKLKAVAIDVYEDQQDTFEKSGLIDHEKIFPAPHLGAATVEAQERAEIEAISILKDFFNV